MKIPYGKVEEIFNESDVESKFLVPLLTNDKPLGLGYDMSDYRTKANIKELTIDKGRTAKLYYPDYVIISSGLPLLIIEAKTPGEDLNEAMRQARLYANELNSKFSRKINPCQKIVVSDGRETACCFVDNDEPVLTLSHEDVFGGSAKLADLLNFASKETISNEANGILTSIRGKTQYVKPKQLLGGKTVQNEEIKENSFGRTLSLDFRNIFNPETKDERKDIVDNAYVTTKRLMRHIQPIEKNY